MRRAGWFVGWLAGLALAGCGPEKEAPDAVRISSVPDTPVAEPVPKQSDPAAKEFVDRCLKAATDGHPERLEKAKTYTSTARGTYKWTDGRFLGASRSVKGGWPDRFRVDHEFPTGQPRQHLIGLRRPAAWVYTSGPGGLSEYPVPNPKEFADAVAVDAVGQHWLPVLVPLTDPATVVFDYKKQDLGTQQVETVKAAVPGCPVFTLWFDPKTSLLGVVTYTHQEAGPGARFQKRLGMVGHKPFGGVMLPTKLEFSRNGESVEEWAVDSWDLGAAVEDAAFDPPKDGKK
ncbi:MAG: hypothetical protein K2X82_16375 [Gemmataceae bacterium]|nr:hypothetical protein [Gemmataceae bacterium]